MPQQHIRKTLEHFYEEVLDNIGCEYHLEDSDSLGYYVSRVESFPQDKPQIIIKTYKMVVKDRDQGWCPMFDSYEIENETNKFYVRPKVLYLSTQLLKTWHNIINNKTPTAEEKIWY